MSTTDTTERRVVFQYMAPVVVEVIDGMVVSVFVVDDDPIKDPDHVEGDETYLDEAVTAANNGQAWPSWQIGY